MFHPNSPYYKVCADVVLVNPPRCCCRTYIQIEHKPLPTTLPTGDASDFKRNINRKSIMVQNLKNNFKGVDLVCESREMGKETKFPIFFLALGSYCISLWINVKIENTMRDVDIR